jgi:hypothetical protein
MKKPKITAKKYLGNDKYSWAVFVDGKPAFTGLYISEVPYYKNLLRQKYNLPLNSK